MNRIIGNKFLFRMIILVSFGLFSHLVDAQENKITIQTEKISLKDAYEEIEKQSGYSIAYGQTRPDLRKEIRLNLREADVDQALKEVLKGSGNSYKINGYHIIIIQSSPGKKEDERDVEGKKPSQTIRGIVIDARSDLPVEYAAIRLMDAPFTGTVSDSLGRFRIPDIPVGRYTIQVSFTGYEPYMMHEVLITSAKEVYLTIPLKESIYSLQEVLVTPQANKEQLLNTMALTGGRQINMEEAGRYANGFDDPARLVTAFAGVAGNVMSNAIAIRGNSPQATQWKLEGVEIPNPTHFADMTGAGGGIFSALSSQVMGNSDFYNGAFPAEYSNALGGVFDMYMRNGNNQKYEHTFQVGLIGIDLASEGPISRKNNSSYIFNYRYSTSGLVASDDLGLRFQDLSFKLNFPTKKAGTFAIWGLGLIDRQRTDAEDSTKWEYLGDRQSDLSRLGKAIGGVSHKYVLDEKTSVRTAIAATYTNNHLKINQLDTLLIAHPIADVKNIRWDVTLNSYLNRRFSSRHVNRTGFTLTGLMYDMDFKVSPGIGLYKPMEQVSKGRGESMFLSFYSSSVIELNRVLTASVGLNIQYFTLNSNFRLEPRLSMRWRVKPQHALAVSYGAHSRREKLDYYFVEIPEKNFKQVNKNLDLARAHHFGLSYDWSISPTLHLKVEPYFQLLSDVPVEENTSFSILNYEGLYLDRELVNEGKGRNYGVDVTLERYLNQGFYYIVNGSFFKSEYKGGDGIWRHTRMDRGFISNVLVGKEWMVGKQKQNMFNLNFRLSIQGGDRYTPIDEKKTHENKEVELDETRAYSLQFDPMITTDLSVSYKINKRKVSHEFAIKLINPTLYTGQKYYDYEYESTTLKREKGTGFIPNISYKIQF